MSSPLPSNPPEKHPVAHSTGGQAIQIIQGAYYVIAGLSVALLIQLLQSETSPHYDLSHMWAVRVIGLLVAAFGAALIASGGKTEGPFVGAGVAMCVAIVLAVLGAACRTAGVLPPSFLIDVGLEVGFASWWAAAIVFWFNTDRSPVPPAPHTPAANG